jgi:hypothetical protein
MLPPKPGQPSPGQPAAPPAPQGAPNGAPPNPGQQAPQQQQPQQPKPMAPRDAAIPSGTSTYTFQPEHANIRLSSGTTKKRLREDDWTSLSNDLSTSVSSAISARQTFEQNLQDWRDAYDLILPQNDDPQFDGANIRLPYSATQLESLKAYIAGTVLVPRMYVVTGRTPAAVQVANEVERFYNSELTKMRADGSSYFQRYAAMIHMALRDGTCVMEVLWNRTRKRTYVETEDAELDEMGNQKFDGDGNPIFNKTLTEVDVFPSDFAEVTPISIQDFLLLPAESGTIESAAAVARCLWLYESDLRPMVRAGILDEDEVERALSQNPSGTSEVAADRQGTGDKNVSMQVDIGLAQGTMSSSFFKNRGPLKIWRIHSSQYDMDGDGEAEENIFYLHEIGNRMLGWMKYDYPVWQRPFFAFTPFPRPDEFYGYSIMERLARVQSEMDINHNTRINLILKKMNAPLVVKDGVKAELKQGKWYMNEVLESEFENGKPAMMVMDIPDIPISAFEDETMLQHYGDAYTSLNQPAVGGQGSGKRSATELRQQNTAAGTRMALICNELRITLAQGINFIHILNKTYMRTDPQFVDQTADGIKVSTLSLDKLSEDLEIGIAGATEPIDSTTRRNEIMAFVEKMMVFPFVQADMSRQWYLARLLSEAFGRVDTTQIIGTVDQAVQMQQQQQQAAMAQHQKDEQFVRETGKEPPPMPGQQKPPHQQAGGSHHR